ncbi:uncharacterized protein LOC100463145 isoform X3 [Nasonia vitripennis]|uniref:Uncharacterized protein n=1 Tax=Nasonia vitripennis TaxID=7425 RepID=A0A7M7QAP0_NASVI|nr:uncharacterized protein LOC100463145 isoform X3 [Nasonia vitripennis]
MGKWRESKSEFYEDRLFVINKKFLQILGRWPYQAKRSRIFLLSLYFVGILTVVVAELIHFVRVIRIKDIPKIIDCLPALIFTYGAMVMIFNSMIKFAEMRQILGKIEENWLSARDAEEYALLKEFAEEGRFLIIGYTRNARIYDVHNRLPGDVFPGAAGAADFRQAFAAQRVPADQDLPRSRVPGGPQEVLHGHLPAQHAGGLLGHLDRARDRRLLRHDRPARLQHVRRAGAENRENRLGLAGEDRERANHRVPQVAQELHRVRRADRVFVHGLAVAAALSQHGRDKRDGRADHKPQGAARGDAQVLAEQPVGDDAALLHLVARPEDDRPQPPRARASVQRRLVRAAGGLEEASAADAAQELEGLPHHGRRHVPHEFRDLLQGELSRLYKNNLAVHLSLSLSLALPRSVPAHADFDVLLYHDSVDAVNFPSMYANKV